MNKYTVEEFLHTKIKDINFIWQTVQVIVFIDDYKVKKLGI